MSLSKVRFSGIGGCPVGRQTHLMSDGATFRLAPLCVLAVSVLSLAGGVYLFIRGPETLYVDRTLAAPSSSLGFRLDVPHQVRAAVACLPTGAHAFAFSLLTAPLLPPSRRAIWRACLFWACIDSGFEFLQAAHSCPFGLSAIENSLVRIACAYVSNGSFDWLDIASIWTGAGLAFLALNRVVQVRNAQEG
jgi:hypothetical protein